MGIKVWWPLLFVGAIILTCVMIFPSDLRLADLLGDAGRYDEAIENYRKVLAKEPERGDIRMQLGQLYLFNDEPEKALAEYEAASESIELDAVQLSRMLEIYSALGLRAKTVSVLEKLVKIAPEEQHYRVRLADAYEWNSDTDKAIALYDELLGADARNLDYLNKLIALHLSTRNYPECINHLNTVLTVQPQNQDARLLLGNIYIENRQRDLAAREFERSLRLDPNNGPLRERLAELYLWDQDYDKGILHYERLFMDHVLRNAYFDKLIALTKDSDPERALKYFNYRLKYLPNSDKLRQRFVDLNVHFGFTDVAIEQLNILIGKQPKDRQYRLQLAGLYKDTQEPALAATVWESLYAEGYMDSTLAAELIPHYQIEKEYDKLLGLYASAASSGFADHHSMTHYAEMLTQMRRYEEARPLYAQLLAGDPGDIKTRLDLAHLYSRMQNEHEAYKTLWQGVEELGIQDEQYLLESMRFFVDRKNHRESIVTGEKLVSLHPDNLYYNSLVTDLYVTTKNFDLAANSYERLIALQPNDINLKFRLASLYWLQNDAHRARRAIEDIQASHANDPNLDREIGRFYFERSFLDEAAEHLEFALASEPSDGPTLRMLGLAYAWNNHPVRAKSVLERYNQMYPDDYYTHYQLGEVLRYENNKEAAAEEFQIALILALDAPDSREALLVKGKIYAYQNSRTQAFEEFEKLISLYPDDQAIYADYAEGLLTLQAYSDADYWIDEVLQKDPDNYRALRLQSRSYFEQGKYKEAAATLAGLEQQYGGDLNLRLDLADTQLAAGDWYGSEVTLKNIMRQFPTTLPAEERLVILRREYPQAFATDYQVEEQSNNFLKEVYRVVLSKATSSLANFKLLFGGEKYSTNQAGLQDAEYQNLGLNVSSRFGARLQTSLTGTARRHLDQWTMSGTGMVRWNFNPSSSLAVSASNNELWRDPFVAAFQEGRSSRVQSEINFTLARKIFLWNRLSYERHSTRDIDRFGSAFRASVLVGYNWFQKPLLSTYYQFSSLDYSYEDAANQNIVSIPEKENIHYVGATISRQLSRRLFYQLGGSLGRNVNQDNFIYYGSIDLEYMFFSEFRLRSQFTYGSLSRLSRNENSKSLKFDLYYFY